VLAHFALGTFQTFCQRRLKKALEPPPAPTTAVAKTAVILLDLVWPDTPPNPGRTPAFQAPASAVAAKRRSPLLFLLRPNQFAHVLAGLLLSFLVGRLRLDLLLMLPVTPAGAARTAASPH
jgi:hypothetical protein